MLCVPELREDGMMPSPEQLKGKVIVKAKKLKAASADEEEEVDDDAIEQQVSERSERALSRF